MVFIGSRDSRRSNATLDCSHATRPAPHADASGELPTGSNAIRPPEACLTGLFRGNPRIRGPVLAGEGTPRMLE